MAKYYKKEDIVNEFKYKYPYILEDLESMPTVDAEPVKHGHWRTDKVAFYSTCSVCGCCIKQDTLVVLLDYYGKYNFCPVCGAKMDDEEE